MNQEDVRREAEVIAQEQAEVEKKKPARSRKKSWKTSSAQKGELTKPSSKAEIIASSPGGLDLSTKTLGEVLFEASLPKVQSDEELYTRFLEYFQRCMESTRIPTVEECMLCTGYSYQYLSGIRTGRNKPAWVTRETPSIISWAFEIVKAYDAKMVMAGKLPQIPYIFRSKNYYNMSDKTEITVTANVGNEQEMSAEEIIKRYAVETSFAEDQEKSK